ncbi:hypothetical protein PZB75_08940 [Streptomyces sp. AM 4-1-1]|uniref:hypothetical protein n=1 Tax=Streptomyces sp. AM 4-1-1 TaxID=3028710 RepID=UPI0023B95837|nr:hypothetical protein [Streptomyces sp. AM 4-1-1]WEH37460.1 hypothetical protein PZB75_08940 [Streptomyces sp. AM 4-1-1]
MARTARTASCGRRGAVLTRFLVLPLVAALGLVLAGFDTPHARAVSVCAGRPAKVVPFATGELRVYKSRAYACALAVARKPGAARPMTVRVQPRGGRAVVDSGTFTSQAGPVTVHALNRCVRVSGTIAGKSADTGWILC